jgi:hypothetical protein
MQVVVEVTEKGVEVVRAVMGSRWSRNRRRRGLLCRQHAGGKQERRHQKTSTHMLPRKLRICALVADVTGARHTSILNAVMVFW